MHRLQVDLAVIGGGPAGMAAALGARQAGVGDVLVIERDTHLGGILQQCIHNGFGLHILGEDLTGPEYAEHFIDLMTGSEVRIMLDSMVVGLSPDKKLTVVNRNGITQISAKCVILAMGCRERTRGAILIPGSRPAGVYTAGTAQKLVNLQGYLPGREAVILGSGDIGLIMARRLALEGCKVKAVVEAMPWIGGLTRNLVQCLHDYNIPLYLQHTVTAIHGEKRVKAVCIASVDNQFRPIEGTEFECSCDLLLLAVGLIPENELSLQAGILMDNRTGGPMVTPNRETSIPGIFACGNVLQVHDLVDNVSREGNIAGQAAAIYILDQAGAAARSRILPGQDIRSLVPQSYHWPATAPLHLTGRVLRPMHEAVFSIRRNEEELYSLVRQHLRPAEMFELRLPAELLAEGGDLSVMVQEVRPLG